MPLKHFTNCFIKQMGLASLLRFGSKNLAVGSGFNNTLKARWQNFENHSKLMGFKEQKKYVFSYIKYPNLAQFLPLCIYHLKVVYCFVVRFITWSVSNFILFILLFFRFGTKAWLPRRPWKASSPSGCPCHKTFFSFLTGKQEEEEEATIV